MKRATSQKILLFALSACAGEEADSSPAFAEAAQPGFIEPSLVDPATAPPVLNAGASPTTLPSGDPVARSDDDGCTKVDFLFVVDNSLSMLEEQTALVQSFPGFMSVVEQTLGATDFHVMVIDTDAGNLRDAVSNLLGRGDAACGSVLGAGRRQSQDGSECGLGSDERYIDRAQADLIASFSCVAEVGTLGDSDEAPVDAMLASLAPDLNGPGGCNAGFLREDAILVVTLIGDEDDAVSAGDPPAWHDALVGIKGGSDQSIVFLGLIGAAAAASPSGACGNTVADPAPRLNSLVESFSFGSTGAICAPDYAPFFEKAVSVIDTACDVFSPIIR